MGEIFRPVFVTKLITLHSCLYECVISVRLAVFDYTAFITILVSFVNSDIPFMLSDTILLALTFSQQCFTCR